MAETLTTLVDAAHEDAVHLLELSRDGRDAASPPDASPTDPRQALHASDAAVAAVSAHLSAMEAVVYPEMARRVPGGRARVAELGRLARRCSSVMRGIEQYVQGDLNRPAGSVASLRRDLAALLAEHAKAEDELLRELTERLSEADRRHLLDRFADAMRHAPTRPHPHLGHGGIFGGSLAVRLLGSFDHLLDVMDSREVAGAPVRAPAPAGLWGWYLLGRPTSPAPEWPAADELAPPADQSQSGSQSGSESGSESGSGLRR
ncbi:hemerythrin HHE cation binding domain-containing protein [Frankia torreyi]|uniref:Hemerythrin HHE cation binding domain-containing protein n=2 Tax=Frankia TaxID=1854 RepID=A0A0D8BD90_9ACTN|nr:hemerythrin domain-containing protein [Frankia torreyi]KJE21929.1 hemerythrin HHE cation binding domain-containing protein [Frankia torreyi]KQM04073.1 hemerythrin HHE cation binding domain-containing protein [Frankia sp. CpI1-P]